jgi:plasmid replication initiation protein
MMQKHIFLDKETEEGAEDIVIESSIKNSLDLVSSTIKPNKIIVQHNNLINGRFDINSSELRVFLYMLASINKDDKEFKPVKVPVSFIAPSKGGKTYKIIKSFQTSLTEKTFTVETLEQNRDKVQRRFKALNIFAEADYLEGENAISVVFNQRIKPYLLQITGNFTSTELKQILNLKNVYSYRIYWLLKQYHTFGERTIELEEFRRMLMLEDKYPNFFSLKPKVLDIAKADLDETDMAFEYEVLRKSNKVHSLRFTFNKLSSTKRVSETPPLTSDKSVILNTKEEYISSLSEMQRNAYISCEKFGIQHEIIKYYLTKLTPNEITGITYKAQFPEVSNKIGFIATNIKELIARKTPEKKKA